MSGATQACILAPVLDHPRTTHDAIRALLLLVPMEPLPEDMSPPAQEAAIRRTLRAIDRLVRVP